MIYLKYNDFVSKNSSHSLNVNENIQLTKKYIKDKVLDTIENQEEISPEELEKRIKDTIDRDENFKKVREMLKKTPGYVYTFYRFMEEGVPQDELTTLYQRLIDNKQFLNNLSLPFDKYADVDPSQYNGRGGYEVLTDDLDFIDLNKLATKFVSNFTSDLKKSYNKASSFYKEKVRNIAKEFTLLGIDDNNYVDPKKNKLLQNNFIKKISRYHTIEDLVKAAESFIKSSSNSNITSFLEKIDKINSQYGVINGAETIFEENDLAVIEVKSFQANKELNTNTSHCIATNQSNWDSYVGSDNLYNKQYYIYNFNLSPSDSNSVIGITIESTGKIRACHNKPDDDMSGQIKNLLKKWEKEYGIEEDLFSMFKPMTPEEVEIKKKRVIANREIIKDGLTIEQYKKCIDDGADPNASNGTPLNNAIKNDKIQEVEYLIRVGANPNLHGSIKYAKDVNMIKVLCKNGAEIDKITYSKYVSGDTELLEYLLKECDMDPNFDKGLIVRDAVNTNNVEVLRLFIKYGGDITIRQNFPIRTASTKGNYEVIEELCKEYKRLRLSKNSEEFSDIKNWIMDGVDSEEDGEKVIKFIESRL